MSSTQFAEVDGSSEGRVTRLSGLMLVAIVVLGASLAGLQYRTSRAIVYARAKEDAETTALSADRLLQGRIVTLTAIASAPDVAGLHREGMKKHFDQFIASADDRAGSLAWVDTSGKVQVSTEFALDQRQIGLGDREYVRNVTELKKPYVSEGLVSRVDQGPFFVIAIPLNDVSGVFRGTLFWGTRIDRLGNELRAAIRSDDIVIIDRRGQVLFSPDVEPLSRPADSFNVEQLRKKSPSVSAAGVSTTGKAGQLVATAEAPTANWLIVRSRPLSSVLKPARQALYIELAILGVVSLGLLLFAARTQRSLRRSEERRRVASERSELVREFAIRLTPAPTQNEVTNVITTFAPFVTSASIVKVGAPMGYRPLANGDEVVLPLSSSGSHEETQEWQQILVDVATPMRDAFSTGVPIWLKNKRERDAQYAHLVEASQKAGVIASASLPLFDSLGRRVGCISFGWNQEQTFDQDQMAMIDTTARLCGQALERSALLDREQAARHQAEALQAFTTKLSSTTDPSRILQLIAPELLKVTGTIRSTVSVLDRGRHAFALIASAGYSNHEPIPSWCTADLETQTLTTQALRSNQITPEPTTGAPRWLALSLPVELFDSTVIVLEFDQHGAPDQATFSVTDLDDIGRRAAQALDRGHRLVTAERSAERARLLALAVSALASAETRAEVATAFTDSVPLLLCSDGFLGVIGDDAETLDVLHAPRRSAATSNDANALTIPLGDTRIGRFLATNQPRFASNALVESLEDVVGEGSHVLIESLAVQPLSWVVLPLTNAGRRIGLVGFFYDTAQEFSDEQRIDLTSYSALCANALARAERFELEHEIAVTLQDSLLPGVPQHIDGTQLAGRYQPSTRNVSVGGDWFDAIRLPDDRFLLVVGDVVGHGIHSAAAMGKLSTATRALASMFPDPARLLERLDNFAANDHDTLFASMALVLVDPTKGTLVCSLAGHPAPLLKTADGLVTNISAGRGPALGVSSTMREQRQTLFDNHEQLVMFTDGLIERRSDHIDLRLEVLRAMIAVSNTSVAKLADTLLSDMLDQDHTDDVALLCVQLATHHVDFKTSIIGEVGSLYQLRIDLRTWLTQIAAPRNDIDDFLLASGEAVTNAIEHGHRFAPQDIAIYGRRVGPLVTLRIADQGTWRPEPLDPGNRGQGLAIMRAVMDTVSVEPTSSGTIIELTKALSTDDPSEGPHEKTEP